MAIYARALAFEGAQNIAAALADVEVVLQNSSQDASALKKRDELKAANAGA